MSSRIEMPSPGIVVVENSSGISTDQSPQHQPQVQHQQHIQAQQVIVNEEYISQENLVSGGVNYITANDLINNAQIFKFVSEEEAAIIEQQQQHHQHHQQDEQQMYGTIGTQQIQTTANTNSKVHVISNVSIVSKAQHQSSGHQAISFVNSKHLPSGGSFVNTYISKQTASSGKTVNIPFKTSVNPIQQQQILTKHAHQAGSVMQKMPVQRNVQVVTRVQTLQPGQGSNNSSNTSVNTNTSGTAMSRLGQPVNSVIQSHQQQQQQSSKQHGIVQTSSSSSSGTGKSGANCRSKSNTTTSMKMMHNSSGRGGIKTIPPQPLKNSTKNSKVIKHYTNAVPFSTSYNVQQQSHPKNVNPPNAINHHNNNKMVQQRSSTTNNTYMPGVLPKVGKNSKYLVSQNQVSHLMLPTQNHQQQQQQQQQQHHQPSQQHQQQQPQQHHQYPQHSPAKLSASHQYQPAQTNVGGAIKYVNAQGNVIAAPSSRVRAIVQQQQQSSSSPHYQQHTVQQHNLYTDSIMSPNTETPSPSANSSNSGGTTSSIDDVVMVNGTHMSEEMSARILQSLSQKTIYNNNNRHYNNQSNQYVNKQQSQQVYLASPSSATNEHHQHHHIQHHPQHQTTHYLQQPQHQQQQQQHHHGYGNNRSSGDQSDQQITSFGPEFFKVNTSDIQSSSTTLIDNIPLIPTRGDDTTSYQPQHDQDEDMHSEELRPTPLTTMDRRLLNLHAILQDHTYAERPNRTETNPQSVPSTVSTTVPSTTTGITLTYMYNPTEKDDDAHSVISNGSRAGNNLENDPGEETETAPEGEGEDDSITKCICDLTHDDGYMICCDKCSTWQHVDCMGIDRQNIPDEYNCDTCQPRQIDKNRARALQLVKRKEQQKFLLLNTQSQQHQQQMQQQQSTTNDGAMAHINNLIDRSNAQHPTGGFVTTAGAAGTASTTNKKLRPISGGAGGSSGASGAGGKRKTELYAGKRKRSESSTARANGKRREPKKISKRKSTKNSQLDSVDKQTANLRAWIENYESAITNHYSPELRARLQAIGKQQQNHPASLPILKNPAALEGQCAVVPHAGGKILISTFDITPNHVVIEIRGKYMLSNQYKQQQIVPPSGNSRNSNGYSRNPGPFIFFYRLPNDGPEICVDTRTYGNEARFVRRSCRPNAEILHTIEKGTIHLYIVSSNNVKSSTEITIKHEPHDLAAVARGNINAPTSTMCACGLTKDCLFSSTILNTPPTTGTSKRPNRANGHMLNNNNNNNNESGNTLGSTPKTTYRRSKNSSTGRGRSTSSSGESNTGLMSPNSNSAAIAVISSLPPILHDSGIGTSSSSPTISLPSPSIQSTQVITPLESPQQISAQSPSHLPTIHHQMNINPGLLSQTESDVVSVVQRPTTLNLEEQTQPILQPQPLPTPQLQFQLQPQAQLQPQLQPQAQLQPQLQPQAQLQPQPQPQPQPPPQPQPQQQHPPQPQSHPQQQQHLEQQQQPPPPPQQLQQTQLIETSQSMSVDELVQSSIKSPSAASKTQSSVRKTPRKSSSSFSEDSSAINDDSVKKDKDSKEKDIADNKKLSREERKMQAIVRAFEKMEKNQQRKQELKQQKTPTSATTPTSGNNSTTSSVQKRLRSNSPHLKYGTEDTPTKKPQTRKKKRRNNRSHHQFSQQRKRLRSRLNSGDSDMITSEESTSMLSPPLPGLPPPLINFNQDPDMKQDLPQCFISPAMKQESEMVHPSQSPTIQSDVDSAAGMLMTLSHCKINRESMQESNLPEKSQEQAPLFPLSSACLLVEAAVGPLEPQSPLEMEFKIPPKTKTKKTIMNDWLHQTDSVVYAAQMQETAHITQTLQSPTMDNRYQSTEQPQHFISRPMHYPPEEQFQQLHHIQSQEDHHQRHPHQQQQQHVPQQMDTYVQVVATNLCDYQITQVPYQEEPQNLSMAAKRVEEFLSITSNDDEDTEQKWSHNTSAETPIEQVQTVPQSLPTPPSATCGSSVKKRWLRQAISEECTDDNVSPTNGYITPLKKRRLARECSDGMGQNTMLRISDLPLKYEEKITTPEIQYNSPSHTISSNIYDHQQQVVVVVKDEMDNDSKYNSELTDKSRIELSNYTAEIKPVDPNSESQMSAEMHSIKDEKYDQEIVDGIKMHKNEKEEKVIVAEIPQFNETPKMMKFFEDNLTHQEQNKTDQFENCQIKNEVITNSVDECVDVKKEEELTIEDPVIEKETAMEESQSIVEPKEDYFDPTNNLDDHVKVEDNSDAIQVSQCEQSAEMSTANIQIEESSKQIYESESTESNDTPCRRDSSHSSDDVKHSTTPTPEPVNEDEFDIQPLPPNEKGKDGWSSESSPIVQRSPNTDPTTPMLINDEIEDIQKRLHSFHNENLMILQSRNKKKLSRAPTPTSGEDIQDFAEKHQSKSNDDFAKDSLIDKDVKLESIHKKSTDSVTADQWKQKEFMTSSMSVASIPTFNQNMLNVPPYPPYMMNNIPSVSGPIAAGYGPPPMPVPLPVPPPPPLPQQQPSLMIATTLNSQYSNSVYKKFTECPTVVSHMTPSSSNNSLLSEYLENPNKGASYSSLGFVSMLDIPRQHSMFNVNPSIPPPSLSTAFLSKSYSTLDSSNVLNSTSSTSTSSTNLTAAPRILTRTQSADPRLNPSLTAPDPPAVPKRKLSINEYRKRKQLSESDKKSSDVDSVDGKKHSSNSECSADGLSVSPVCNKATAKETVFSPAPTLLEMQQENLSKRLKNYKSLHGLSTSIITNRNDFGDSDDKEIQSILKLDQSSMLSGSTSSLTSMSSSTTTSNATTPTSTPPPASLSSSSTDNTIETGQSITDRTDSVQHYHHHHQRHQSSSPQPQPVHQSKPNEDEKISDENRDDRNHHHSPSESTSR